MQDNRESSEQDLAVGDRRCCRKNSPSILFTHIGKRMKEGCDRGSMDTTVQSKQSGGDPAPPERLRGSGSTDIYERGFVSSLSLLSQVRFAFTS